MRELEAKLFRRAVEIAGDAQKLCTKLHIEAHALQLWMAGRATPPGWVLHAVIDLIVDDDLARAAQDRRQQPRCRKPPEGGEQGPADAVSGPRSP
jgi:hypothetical protein